MRWNEVNDVFRWYDVISLLMLKDYLLQGILGHETMTINFVGPRPYRGYVGITVLIPR